MCLECREKVNDEFLWNTYKKVLETEKEVIKILSEIDKHLKLTKAKFIVGKRERFRL